MIKPVKIPISMNKGAIFSMFLFSRTRAAVISWAILWHTAPKQLIVIMLSEVKFLSKYIIIKLTIKPKKENWRAKIFPETIDTIIILSNWITNTLEALDLYKGIKTIMLTRPIFIYGMPKLIGIKLSI